MYQYIRNSRVASLLAMTQLISDSIKLIKSALVWKVGVLHRKFLGTGKQQTLFSVQLKFWRGVIARVLGAITPFLRCQQDAAKLRPVGRPCYA